MPLQRLCKYIAVSVYRNLDTEYTENDILVFEKKIGVLVIYILLIPFLILFGLNFNLLYEITLSTISLAIIRYWNGGNHFQTPDLCLAVTLLTIVINPIIVNHIHSGFVYGILSVYSAIITALFGPYKRDVRNKTIIRKTIALVFCGLSYYISLYTCIAFFLLSFDLIVKNERFNRM